MAKPKIIEIDDNLCGYSDRNKIKKVYDALREEIPKSSLLQVSPNALVTIRSSDSERGSGYEWELYKIDEALILLEAWGYWQGYAPRGTPQPKLSDKLSSIYAENWHSLKLTIHNDKSGIENRLKKIIKSKVKELSSEFLKKN